MSPTNNSFHFAKEEYVAFEKAIVARGFDYIDSGAYRHTYQRGKVVIKIPRNYGGIDDNAIEARAWRYYRSNPTERGIKLAPCRLLSNGCLMMVAVNTNVSNNDLPVWSDYLDGSQVGYHHKEVVAYDYALDVPVIEDLYFKELKEKDNAPKPSD